MSDRTPMPPTPRDSPDEDDPEIVDPFAGLTSIDVVDGELVPRTR